MAICPYCSEEIQESAAKCKHCGEWLDPTRRPTSHEGAQLVVQSGRPDYSSFHKFIYETKAGGSWVFAVNEEKARAQIVDAVPPDTEVSALWQDRPGEITCPNCGNQYTVCQRNFGWIFVVVVFISLGLGLLAIPFLPYYCKCQACGHRWKT